MFLRTNYAGARVRTYEEALKLERDRERNWRKTQQGAFESQMLSIDLLPEGATQEDLESWTSDGGRGAAAIRSFEDEDALNYYLRRQRAALKLVRRELPECVETLKGIFRNGSNRKETICEMSRPPRTSAT